MPDTILPTHQLYIDMTLLYSSFMQVCVLLLDTEGEDDVSTSQNQDMKIYTLTAMMSSVLVRLL